MQPIENAAQISGTVRDVRPNDLGERYVDLVLAVERAEDVGEIPNLLGQTVGHELAITTEAEHVGRLALQPGAPVVVDAELRGPGAVWSRPGGLRRA